MLPFGAFGQRLYVLCGVHCGWSPLFLRGGERKNTGRQRTAFDDQTPTFQGGAEHRDRSSAVRISHDLAAETRPTGEAEVIIQSLSDAEN